MRGSGSWLLPVALFQTLKFEKFGQINEKPLEIAARMSVYDGTPEFRPAQAGQMPRYVPALHAVSVAFSLATLWLLGGR